MEFRLLLKEYRLKMNLSQSKLAEELGFDRTTIGKYETGKRIPDKETENRIRAFLNIPNEEILQREVIKAIDVSKYIKARETRKDDEGFIKRNLQIRESFSVKLNDTAYWDRKSIKDVLDEALELYFKGKE